MLISPISVSWRIIGQADMNTKIKICILFTFFLWFLVPKISFAADIRVEVENVAQVGSEIPVKIFIDTDEVVNAIEGALSIPNDVLDVDEVRDGGSIVNLWIEKPRMETRGRMVFSGITPGGFKGKSGLIVTIILKAKQTGSGRVEPLDFKVFKNDGTGTSLGVSYFSANFSISNGTGEVSGMNDVVPPETFKPVLARDERIFRGNWFIAFETKDKETSVSEYYVKEFRPGIAAKVAKWVPATSPFELNDQELKSNILVKAVDNNGNEIISRMPPQREIDFLEKNMWWLVIISLLIISSLIRIIWVRKRG